MPNWANAFKHIQNQASAFPVLEQTLQARGIAQKVSPLPEEIQTILYQKQTWADGVANHPQGAKATLTRSRNIKRGAGERVQSKDTVE